LQPDLAGKSMRCPNLECRQIFTVREQLPRAIDPPPPPPETIPLPDEPDDAPAPGKRATRSTSSVGKKSEKPRHRSNSARSADDDDVVDAEVIEAAVVNPPQVKEVVWSEGADLPTPKASKRARPKVEDNDFRPIRRRKKKKNIMPIILIGLSICVVLLSGFLGLYLWVFSENSEKKAAEAADKEYAKPDYPAAARSFEKLVTDYPDNENTPRYQFFADLSRLQVVVGTVTNRDDPKGAIDKFESFLKSQKDSPFAKPTKSSHGGEIYKAGKKLEEDIVLHAKDCVKNYSADRSGKAAELERAVKAIETGRALLVKLEPFRSPDEIPLDSIRTDFDQVEVEVKKERDRIAALKAADRQLMNPELSDAVIQQVEGELANKGWLADPEAQEMLAKANRKLRELVRYESDVSPPVDFPPATTASLLFMSPIGKTRSLSSATDGTSRVFLAMARGILTAIEENTGAMLWAVRIGQEITDLPAIAKVDLENGPTDLAIVTSQVGGAAALSCYVLQTGQPRWYQPLPAPAAGPAVVVGTRAFVPIRDNQGTIYEYDLLSGNRKGHIRLAQPAGPGGVVRPGTGLLYVAADARRIYVIDALIRDEDGRLKPPQCVQVLATGHPAGTLRTPPVMIGPDGDAPAERWMILSQADGPGSMKLRAFQVLPIPTAAADGRIPEETAAASAGELPLRGWAWFPPVTDGERLAVVTDASQLRLFELKQPANLDKALFGLPEPKLPTPPEGVPVRGMVFPAEEAAFWVLSNGVMQKFRLGLIAARGVEMLPVGPSIPLGEPTQAPQFNARKDATCLVVRSQNSDGYKAVLLNLRDGSFLWQRTLGLVPATAPLAQEEGLLLVSKDGGLLMVPKTVSATPGPPIAANTSWVIAPPPENVTGTTSVALSPDGKTICTVTLINVNEDLKLVPKYLVRRVTGGKLVHEGTVNALSLANGASAPLAGAPVLIGESLILPLANGIIYRHLAGTGRSNPDTLIAGPPWSGDQRVDASLRCYITPLPDGSFLTSDGTKKLSRWDWPADGRWNPVGSWELREQPAGPGLLLPPAGGTGPARLLIADVSGSVWLYANDRGGQPLRRFGPSGRPSSPLVMQLDAAGKPIVAYTVEEKTVVCLDPERDLPRAARTGDDTEGILVGSPQRVGDGRWAITDLGGHVTVFDTTFENRLGSAKIPLPGAVPATACAPLGGSALLTPLLDGSAVLIALPGAKEAPFAPDPPEAKAK
jgi:hypothetical protein